MVTNLKFRVFIIIFYTRINICPRLYISRLHFNCAMICIRNKMNGMPVKNHRKKPKGFLKEPDRNSCEISKK